MAKKRYMDITGRRNGMLVAAKSIGTNDKGHRIWLCQCDCGNTREVTTRNFWLTKSCGCINNTKSLMEVDRDRVNLKEGHTYEEYILKLNEETAYPIICEYLKTDFETARRIYDKISALDLHDIGILKPIGIAHRKASTLQTLKTGEDWRSVRISNAVAFERE